MLLRELAPATSKPGTYAAVKFSEATEKSLVELQESLGIPNPLDSSEFHSTLLYSRKHLPNYLPLGELTPVQTSDSEDFTLDIWASNGGEKNILVLIYPCEWLKSRWESLSEEHGASWDFPDFTPHITLSYDVGDFKLPERTVHFTSKKPIVIVEEYSSALNEEYGS